MEQLIYLVNELKSTVENYRDFDKQETCLFYRDFSSSWKGENQFNIWKVLLDMDTFKISVCCVHRGGYVVVTKNVNDQWVVGPAEIKHMILSGDKETVVLGRTMLDNIARKKYKLL